MSTHPSPNGVIERRLITQDFNTVFQDVDALLTPTAPSGAFPLGDKVGDPLAMYLNDVFTVSANLSGMPGISVPAGLSNDGLPLGLQGLAPNLAEETVFKVAGVLEEAAQFNHKPADWWSAAA